MEDSGACEFELLRCTACLAVSSATIPNQRRHNRKIVIREASFHLSFQACGETLPKGEVAIRLTGVREV